MEETGYNVLVAYGSMMIAYLRLLLKLSYKEGGREGGYRVTLLP